MARRWRTSTSVLAVVTIVSAAFPTATSPRSSSASSAALSRVTARNAADGVPHRVPRPPTACPEQLERVVQTRSRGRVVMRVEGGRAHPQQRRQR